MRILADKAQMGASPYGQILPDAVKHEGVKFIDPIDVRKPVFDAFFGRSIVF